MPQLESILHLNRDMRIAASTMSEDEARFLVDAYYIMQEDRKRANNQVLALKENLEPNSVLSWLATQSETLEDQIKGALDIYTKNHLMGSWMREIFGIGPVLSAGILAHINIEKAPTAGHIWQFAGIAGDNQRPWNKGEKRPYNAKLKTLCWKIGQSFMKFSNNEKCLYGKLYRARKELEIEKNERLEFKDQAEKAVSRVSKTTEAWKYYSIGKLPPGHIDARARRYAVKYFLSDLHNEWYYRHFKKNPPLPYAIAILKHAHLKNPEKFVREGLSDAATSTI